MIFRLSQKLNAKIKAGTMPALPLDENPFADWSAHLFVADRTQYILLSNTKSLYSTVIYGRGITDESQFLDHALSGLRDFMQQDGLEFVFRRFIAPAGATVQFAKALDRSVTSSINQLVFHATAMLVEDGLSPFEVGFNLNDVLLSAIAPSKSAKYGKPQEAFKALMGGMEGRQGMELKPTVD
jgi:hypothetical protein